MFLYNVFYIKGLTSSYSNRQSNPGNVIALIRNGADIKYADKGDDSPLMFDMFEFYNIINIFVSNNYTVSISIYYTGSCYWR